MTRHSYQSRGLAALDFSICQCGNFKLKKSVQIFILTVVSIRIKVATHPRTKVAGHSYFKVATTAYSS